MRLWLNLQEYSIFGCLFHQVIGTLSAALSFYARLTDHGRLAPPEFRIPEITSL